MRRTPLNIYEEFEQAGNRFASTIFAFVSAVVKLSRIGKFSPGTKLYRGTGGIMHLPDSFYSPDDFGTRGYVEVALMSVTADLQVAVQHSGARERKPIPTVMVIVAGAVDRPCFTRDFSQCGLSSVRSRLLVSAVLMMCRYPGEHKWLWPPFSVVQPSGDSWVELHDGRAVTM